MSNETPTLDYRDLLEHERASLTRQIAELGFGEDGATGPEYDSNFADSSQVNAERGEAEALVSELRSTLREVERALDRLAEGTYGICERCGKPIAPARLEAMPAVTTCIEHAAGAR